MFTFDLFAMNKFGYATWRKYRWLDVGELNFPTDILDQFLTQMASDNFSSSKVLCNLFIDFFHLFHFIPNYPHEHKTDPCETW